MLVEQPEETPQQNSPPTPHGNQESLKQKADKSKSAMDFMTQGQFKG